MRQITLIMAYYENPSMLALQLARLAGMSSEVLADLHLIVVDDGSPTKPAVDSFGHVAGIASQSLFRMRVDVAWNQDACRNLAVARAKTEWVLLTDIDHLVPQPTLLELMTTRLPADVAYQFERVTLTSLDPWKMSGYKHHPNTWFMTRSLYEAVGGYDERFAGNYGTDGDFETRLKAVAGIVRLRYPIIRVPREVVPDASTTTYSRRSEANTAALTRIKRERDAASPWRPLNGMFPWEQVV